MKSIFDVQAEIEKLYNRLNDLHPEYEKRVLKKGYKQIKSRIEFLKECESYIVNNPSENLLKIQKKILQNQLQSSAKENLQFQTIQYLLS